MCALNSDYAAKRVSRRRAMLIVSFLVIGICATAYGWSIRMLPSPSSSQGVPSYTESTTTTTMVTIPATTTTSTSTTITTTTTTSTPTTKTSTILTEYPDYVEGVFYNATAQSGKVIVPLNYLKEHKLVCIDVKTKEKMETSITYEGRLFPLYMYSDGQHLPIMLVMSPSGKIHGLLRFHVTDTCFDFYYQSYHIFCRSCGTGWDIVTLECDIVHGCGCLNTPLLTLPVTVSEDSVSIDVGEFKALLA